MPNHIRKSTRNRIARFAIWTIRHQTLIISRLIRYIWAAALITLLFALAGVITLDAAIYSIFMGGMMILFFNSISPILIGLKSCCIAFSAFSTMVPSFPIA